mgnify:CR=1 FL=1
MIDLQEAQRLILAATPVLGSESVPFLEALRRVLARDIVATEDSPGSDISTKDGYALHHASLQGASAQCPVFLKIIGESAAGRPCGATVEAREAVRIMAGGMMPGGGTRPGGGRLHGCHVRSLIPNWGNTPPHYIVYQFSVYTRIIQRGLHHPGRKIYR